MVTRVLIVDDFERWRRFTSEALEEVPDLKVIAEASDGLSGVQKAQEFQPDLILLDVGLPGLNGIEAARQIRNSCPRSKILIVSEQHAPEIILEALRVGVHGYVVKTHARQELLPALNLVLRGGHFVSGVELEAMKSKAGANF